MSIMKQFLRHPLMTGAVAASSPKLAHAMTENMGIEDASLIVEVGPGTGAITDAILPRMAEGAQLVLVELNPGLAASLSERYRGRPVHVVNGSAAELSQLIPGPSDVVISGLPWTVMVDAQQRRILDSMCEVLTQDGKLSTFAYLHAARIASAQQFNEHLADRFDSIERSSTVWANFPPAFVHRAGFPRLKSHSEFAPSGTAADSPEFAGRPPSKSMAHLHTAASLRANPYT
jgi:phosphatidylethanolamine/phosphatidyl-N-methylethanolamine N-methyltransferase